MELGLYPEAEEQFEAAEKLHPAGYDRNLIYGLFFQNITTGNGRKPESSHSGWRIWATSRLSCRSLKILEDTCKKILKDRKPDQLSE